MAGWSHAVPGSEASIPITLICLRPGLRGSVRVSGFPASQIGPQGCSLPLPSGFRFCTCSGFFFVLAVLCHLFLLHRRSGCGSYAREIRRCYADLAGSWYPVTKLECVWRLGKARLLRVPGEDAVGTCLRRWSCCCSSGVEHSLGKGEVECSNHSSSTSQLIVIVRDNGF